MKEERLQLKFQGNDDIDLETLSIALNSTVESLKIIADNVIGEDEFCKFRIKEVRKGSFIVDILKIIEENQVYILGTITALGVLADILSIRQLLKGDKAKKVKQVDNGVQITNSNGETNVYNIESVNIYTSSDKIETELSKMCKAISNEEERTGIEFNITGDTNKTIVYTKEDVDTLSKPMDVESLNDNDREEVIDTLVTVHKPDLVGKSKWDLYLLSQPIKASILDTYFLCKVQQEKKDRFYRKYKNEC